MYRIMHELLWIMIWGHEWGDLPIIFPSDEVMSENQLANRLTSDLKIVMLNNKCIILFLICYFMSWTHNATKNNYWSLILPLLLRTFFRNKHCDVTTVDLWRHANVGYWHCDIISVDCSCTHRLAQRGSSLENNNREYRFLTTWYSRLSM